MAPPLFCAIAREFKPCLFTATWRVVAAETIEDEDEPDDVAPAHAAEIHAPTTIQKKQEIDEITATSVVRTAVCKEIHYVPYLL